MPSRPFIELGFRRLFYASFGYFPICEPYVWVKLRSTFFAKVAAFLIVAAFLTYFIGHFQASKVF